MQSTQTQPALAFTGLHKKFDDKQVLNHIEFSVSPGEIFGLVGLNGTGKTTLINILLGLTAADAGHVQIFGENASHPSSRRHLTYLPEKLQPTANLKGMEYIRLALQAHGQKIDKPRIQTAAKSFKLDNAALPQLIRRYSKGMAQKLGLMAAFLINAPLMILDEPMSGLDPEARSAVKHAMQQAKAQGRTIFFSSHILADIEEICDKIAIMHEGSLVFLGTAHTLLQTTRQPSLEKAFLQIIGR